MSRGLARAAATLALLAATCLGSAAAAAAAGPQLGLHLREVDTAPGALHATVSLSGQAFDPSVALTPGAFHATLAGKPSQVTATRPLSTSSNSQVSIVLAIDTSQSMSQGGKLELAKGAADQFAAKMPSGARIGVVSFSDTAQLALKPTADAAKVQAAVRQLRASGNTAVHDAVITSLNALAGQPGQRTIVLLSDGKDTASKATLATAIADAKSSGTAVYTVGLSGGEQDPQALLQLARQTGGRYLPAQAAQLGDVYAGLGQELASQYIVDINIPAGTPSSALFRITVAFNGVSASDERLLLGLAPLASAPGGGPVSLQPAPPLSRLQGPEGLWLVAVMMFLAVLLVALTLVTAPPGRGKAYRELRRRISQYSLTPALVETPQPTMFGTSELAGKATTFAETLVRRGNLEEAFLSRLEAAGLRVRVAEYLLLSLGSAFGLPLLVLAATRNLLATILAVGIGVAAPFLFLRVKAARRQARFDAQLPDTLQLLGGALKAGHSLLQAVDTVVQEAEDPIAGEFQRVLTEARLGMPVEEALENMTHRMNSIDFEWTVMAINLQRQVGGNLAEVLGTVAQTIRERYSLKRQIRALSAEGRLSSMILTILPFLMFTALLLFNPRFLAPLYTTSTGVLLLAAAAALMLMGIVWLRRITDIKV